MRKLVLLFSLALLLAGCGVQETFETVDDVLTVAPTATPQQFFVSLPEDAATPTFQDDTGELYVCQDFTVSKQILEGGDLEKTVQNLTGKSQEELQVIKTVHEDWDRYDLVWTSAGEDGLQVGRACILDDGNYHYILSTMAEEEKAGQLREVFQDMYDSCKLLDTDINLSTGS